MKSYKAIIFIVLATLLLLDKIAYAQAQGKPLVIQEMSWPEVKDYLTHSDMVVIPMGSTEQHGPHLPLGTDYIECMDMVKQISAKTGVLIAPSILVGYSAYHTGFPGTLSIRPETMVQALFETTQCLIKYGFHRIMIFNFHGGNKIVEDNLVNKINQETEATAVSIGWGSAIQNLAVEDSLDYHSGIYETSVMLYLEPNMVRMDKFKKPIMHFTPKVEELMTLSKEYPLLINVWESLLGVPSETNKGGASHEFSNNGIWSLKDSKVVSAEIGKKIVEEMVGNAVKFIESWKKVQK